MKKPKKIPLRKCVGCQEMKPKSELLRVVRLEDQQIVPDRSGRLNGRGAYLCRSSGCLELAVKHKSLERSLGHAVSEETVKALKKEIEEFETG